MSAGVARGVTAPRARGDGPWPYLLASPLALIFAVFLVVPIATLILVSFLDYNSVQILWRFVTSNYSEALTDPVTWETYLNTLRFAALTWAITLFVGFWVAYFLAFEVRSATWQTGLFLLCTVPFLTSNVIRMISWIPFLGREGLLNTALLRLGLIHKPLLFLLFSNFAVVLAYVHLYTLFMVVPIFNSMMRIDPALIEAARDAGAGFWRTVLAVIVPLSKTGIAIGTIFVVTLVMGDFITVQIMSGGQGASVGLMIQNEISLLQYPAAAANAVILLAVVLGMVAAILRLVDIRQEL